MLGTLRYLMALAAVMMAVDAARGQDTDSEKPSLFARVAQEAKARAEKSYTPPPSVTSEGLRNLTYDDYQKIKYRRGQALWRGESLFEVQFAHPGFLYTEPVTIHTVEDGKVRDLTFDKAMFEYLDPALRKKIPEDSGFAGFRILYPLHRPEKWDEVAVFLGASYFRLLGRNQAYGISARGLAVDTATSGGEEFPAFREFWLVKPEPKAKTMTVYALLDSRSMTGAYRFDIRPGDQTIVDVKAAVFMRAGGKKVGLAPMTSMFLYGENRTRRYDDFRPEIHDSDGLLMHTGSGEWIWRPLTNPPELRVSALLDNNPRGFGLLQRDRDFEHYLDLEAEYERRPSLWITPRGDWGKGRVELVEIPSEEEINDNIVAYWVPQEPPEAGARLDLEYRIRARSAPVLPQDMGHVTRTRIGWGGVPGTEDAPPESLRRFIVTFEGGSLAGLSEKQPVKAELETSAGRISDIATQKVPDSRAWRVSFRLSPADGQSADMRLFLTLRDRRLTETWNYVYAPAQLN